MNPRLVKFAVELQNAEKLEKKEQCSINIKEKFYNFLKLANVTVPINKD